MQTERHTAIPQQQPMRADEVPIPAQLDTRALTPVFGTDEAGDGPADALRRQAYARPAHDPFRWLTLLAADRVESGGALIGDALTPGQQGEVVRHYARQARSYQQNLALGALVLGGALLLRAASR